MTAPAKILSDNPKRTSESVQGWALRALNRGMRIAHNEGIAEAERIILYRQEHPKNKIVENELSNIVIELHEMKVAPQ